MPEKIDDVAFEKEVKARLEEMDIKISECKFCQREIIWLYTERGKSMPVTLELRSHFIDCPHAVEARKGRRY